MPDRELSVSEAKNLLTQLAPPVTKWPSSTDIKLIAKAVSKRESRVKLSDGKWYKIRYESRWEAVFVKPEGKDFVPCGYLEYARLKQVLA